MIVGRNARVSCHHGDRHRAASSTPVHEHHLRRGALLPAVLVVMVIIALAAGAALFTVRQERRASWNTRLQTAALGTADRAVAELIAALSEVAPTLDIGASAVRRLALGDGRMATARFARLGPTLLMLTVDGDAVAANGAAAHRGTSMLLRLDPPALGFPTALAVTGATPPLAGLADDSDRAPSGWPCANQRADSSTPSHPSPAPDSAIVAVVRSRAAFTIPAGSVISGPHPTVHDAACVTGLTDNWGDPGRTGPCGSWLPVVHAPGDLAVDGGVGQGTMLVDGDLVVGGGFRYSGAVIVRGALEVRGGGATITGAVIANEIRDASGITDGDPVVLRSSCAIDAALVAAGALVPIAERPWAPVR